MTDTEWPKQSITPGKWSFSSLFWLNPITDMCSHHPTPVAWGDKDEWEAVLEEPSFLLWWLPVSSPVPQVAWQRVKWSPLGLWALAWIPRSLILKAWEVGPTITSFPLPQITHLGMPGLSPAFWMTKSGNLLENDSLQVAELLKSHSQGGFGKLWVPFS